MPTPTDRKRKRVFGLVDCIAWHFLFNGGIKNTTSFQKSLESKKVFVFCIRNTPAQILIPTHFPPKT